MDVNNWKQFGGVKDGILLRAKIGHYVLFVEESFEGDYKIGFYGKIESGAYNEIARLYKRGSFMSNDKVYFDDAESAKRAVVIKLDEIIHEQVEALEKFKLMQEISVVVNDIQI